MSNQQEVKVRTGALTEGTRHRRDKGPEDRKGTEGLVEVIGAYLCRTRVKRRKASALGKLANGSESPVSVGSVDVVATALERSWLRLTQGDLLGRHGSGSLEGRKNEGP